MTTVAAQAGTKKAMLPARLVRALVNLVIGSLLCLSPLTALLVLGWLTRRMGARIHNRLGQAAEQPGWVFGPRGRGWIARLMGGLAANVRSGLMTAIGLAALTLPFSMLWLGAWWAGWDNSFNKGYEQSIIGPAVWIIGALIALPVLVFLPVALAHAAAEGRLGAFFELRRIRQVARAAGWRLPWLGLMSIILSLPFLGLRVIAVFIEGFVPGFADMTVAEQMQVGQILDLVAATLTFVILVFLRDRASSVYARAVARTAPLPSCAQASLWFVTSCVIWAGLPILIMVSQFMNYSTALWITHPMFLLPWAG